MTEEEILQELKKVNDELRKVITWHVIKMVPLKKTKKFLDRMISMSNKVYSEKVIEMGKKYIDLYAREDELNEMLEDLRSQKNQNKNP